MQSPLLEQLTVTTPCPADWGQMRGDDRVRYCGLCGEHVYNLREMTDEEVLDLIRGTAGRFCGTLYARGDGTFVSADCAARQRRRPFQFSLRCVMLLLTGFAAFFGIARFVHQNGHAKEQLPEPLQLQANVQALGLIIAPELLDAIERCDVAPDTDRQD